MRKWLFMGCCMFALAFPAGCSGSDDDNEDTGDPWDTEPETDDTGSENNEYECIDGSEVDEDECGPYPEHDNEMWDILAVVPNSTFKAFYDRDCDGVPEETTLDMYRDVYCQRDRIKSLVLAVGSNCGSDGGED